MPSISEHLEQYPDWLHNCGISLPVANYARTHYPDKLAPDAAGYWLASSPDRGGSFVVARSGGVHGAGAPVVIDQHEYEGLHAVFAWGQWFKGVRPLLGEGYEWRWLADPYRTGCMSMAETYPEFEYVSLQHHDLIDGDEFVAGCVVEALIEDGETAILPERDTLEIEAGINTGEYIWRHVAVHLADESDDSGCIAPQWECYEFRTGQFCLESETVTIRGSRRWPERDVHTCDRCNRSDRLANFRENMYGFEYICDACCDDFCGDCENELDDCTCNGRRGSGVLDYSSDVHGVLGVPVPDCERFNLTIGVELEIECETDSQAETWADELRASGRAIGCHDGSLGTGGVEAKFLAVLHSDWWKHYRLTPKPVGGRAWGRSRCGVHVNVGLPVERWSHEGIKDILRGVTSSAVWAPWLRAWGRREASQYAPCGSGVDYNTKYCAINTGKRGRIEFRLFQSTLNADSLAVYVDFSHAMVLWAWCACDTPEGSHERLLWGRSESALVSFQAWLLEFGGARVNAFAKSKNLILPHIEAAYNNLQLKVRA